MENNENTSTRKTFDTVCDKIIEKFNSRFNPHGISCQTLHLPALAVSFYTWKDEDEIEDSLENGHLFDAAYALDNDVDPKTVKEWVKEGEWIEASESVSEYLYSSSLEDYVKNPDRHITEQFIEETERKIRDKHKYSFYKRCCVQNEVDACLKGFFASRKKGHPSENRISGGNPHDSAGNGTTDG